MAGGVFAALKLTGFLGENGILVMYDMLPCTALIVGVCIIMCQIISLFSTASFGRKEK